MNKTEMTAAIIGASRPAQVEENAAASGANVPLELFTKAEQIIGAAMH